jgi:FimV-like protein
MLVALFRANPQAFMGQNMNRMKAGAVLTLPKPGEWAGTPTAEARNIVQAHSADFGAYRSRLASALPKASIEPAPPRQAGGRVQTPPLSSGCLAGVTRGLVIEACQAADIPVEEIALPITVLQTCDEAFLSSSTRDVHPLARINERVMPGVSGAVTQRVAQAFRDYVAGRDDP